MEDRVIHVSEEELAHRLGCSIILYMKEIDFDRYNGMTSVSNGNRTLSSFFAKLSPGNPFLKKMSKLIDLKEKGVLLVNKKLLTELSKDKKTKTKAAGLISSPHLAKVLIDVDRSELKAFLSSAGHQSENLGIDSRNFRLDKDIRKLAEAVYKQWFGDDQFVESPYRCEISQTGRRGSAVDEPRSLVSTVQSTPSGEALPIVTPPRNEGEPAPPANPRVAQPQNEGDSRHRVYKPTNGADGNINLFIKENEHSSDEPNEIIRRPPVAQPITIDTGTGYLPTNDAEGNQNLLNKSDMRQSSDNPNQMVNNKIEAEGLRSEVDPNSCHNPQDANPNCPVGLHSAGCLNVNTATTHKSCKEEEVNRPARDVAPRVCLAESEVPIPAQVPKEPARGPRPVSAPTQQGVNDMDTSRNGSVHSSLPAGSVRPGQLQDPPPLPATATPPNIVENQEKKPTQAVDSGTGRDKPQDLRSNYYQNPGCPNPRCSSSEEVLSPDRFYSADGNLGISKKDLFKDLVENQDIKEHLIMYLEPNQSCIKNWRNLASKLDIKEQQRKFFESQPDPNTLQLFNWILSNKPSYTIQNFKEDMAYYERYDILNFLRKKNY